MVVTRYSMDVHAVRNIGNQLKHEASEIGRLIQVIESQVAHAIQMWHGNDANQFHDWWATQQKPALVQLQRAIDGFGQGAVNSAAAQERISGH